MDLQEKVRSFLDGPLQPYYGASFHAPVEGGVLPVWGPSLDRKIGSVGLASAADVDLAVASARLAFDEGPWWNGLKPSERQACLWSLAEGIERDAEILAQIDALDSGKPVHMTLEDVKAAAAHLFYYAGWSTKIEGRTHPVDSPGVLAYSVREPVGVVGLISPWNYPLLMAVWKLAPALAAGNSVILKPAEQTPLSALYLSRLVEEAGFPPGVFNVVPGLGPDAGAALVEHPSVDKVAFTGSASTARSIVRGSVGNLKRISLELGGKSPNIVFADADLDEAIHGATWAMFGNNGQSCTAGSRLYIQREVFDRVLDGVVDASSRISVGPALSVNKPDLGPLVSAEHLRHVSRTLEEATAGGGEAAVGGSRPTGVPDGGYYLAPTVLTDIDDTEPINRHEVFGPVATAMPFDELDEVLLRANVTDSGLAGGVWTKDIDKAHTVASRLRAGTVWINTWGLTEPGVPFGGMKQSGHGREMGEAAFDLYTETKSVWVRYWQ